MIAIFGFIWGFLRFIVNLFRGKSKSVVEEYILKGIKYVLLVNVVVLNGFVRGTNELMQKELMLTGLVLLLYFFSNMQKNQQKHVFMKSIQTDMPVFKSMFSLKGEIAIISISVVAFFFFVNYPQYASYGLSQWFYDGIVSIENTFIIGFVFKVIGFFFLINVIFKIINTIISIVFGAPLLKMQRNARNRQNDKNDDHFDDFEEIN